MKIAEAAVARPQFTLVLFALLVALGWNSLRTIPRAEDPSFPIRIFSVVAVYPGAAPSDMEQLVVDPLQDRISELDDLKELTSTAEDGVSLTIVEFEADADTARKYEEVVREVNATRADLPENLQRLEVTRVETTNVAVLQIALLSETASWRELQRQAERLEDRLEAVTGVKEIDTWAYPAPYLRSSAGG